MKEKRFNSRVVHKHGTAASWKLATNFIPMQGEIIVYDRDNNYDYERFKIGDGVTLVNDLPFAVDTAVGALGLLSAVDAADTYQTKSDETLSTTDKTIVGAINEINSAINNTNYTETDPTVPAWAKAENKPTYTAEEVGALPADTKLFSGSYNDLTEQPELFSGSYEDLTNKPSIPSIDGLATEKYVVNSICNTLFGGYNEGLAYRLNDDGISYTVTGRGTCTSANIIIPSTYQDKPVTGIHYAAFNNQTDITSIIIPASITNIGAYAFSPRSIHLYCEIDSQPAEWDADWNAYGCPVTWGFTNNFISINEKINSLEIPSIDGLASEEYVNTQISKIEIPETLVELSDDANHRLVTDDEKTAWNAKSEFSGSYDDLTGIPTEFTPSEHTHSYNDLTNVPTEFTPASHDHDASYLALSEKGSAGGVAALDESGKVPTSQLPSYVDDVLEYSTKSAFPTTGESGKIYVDTTENLTYRWGGSTYVEISKSLALGETSSTAYAGDKGKTAYDHSQKTSGNPHKVTKSDVGLGNVDNTADANKTVAKANQLTTARKIALSSGVTGTATSFDGSNDISIPVTDIKESYVSWGGKTVTGNTTPFDDISIGTLTNCFAFLPLEGVTYEYTRDGGETWIEGSPSANLFIPSLGGTNSLPKPYTTNDKIRITIDNAIAGHACTLNKLLLKVYNIGVSVGVIIEHFVNNTLQSTKRIDNLNNWNSIPVSYVFYMNYKLRFTFEITGLSEHNNPGFSVEKIIGLGKANSGSNLAKFGQLYSFDGQQNATFPARVSATEFIEGGTSLQSKYASTSALTTHTSNTSNPHNVTKAQVGLGNVENKSSATIRGELTKDNVTTALGYTPPEQDTVYTHPSTHAASMITGLADVATSGSYNDLTDVPTEFTPSEHVHNDYQAKSDDSLETEDKTVVGAINEVNARTVDKIEAYSDCYGDYEIYQVDKAGIYHGSTAYFTIDDADREFSTELRVPIAAGENVTFTKDSDNQVVKINATSNLPSCTTSNNGQFLRVVNGVATWATVPNAEEASF